jgi:hypothetical protein
VSSAVKAARLDRAALLDRGAEPDQAMRDASEWVTAQAGGARAVLVGYPVVFDWMFIHWYFVRFLGESPFGFSGALDIKTIYHQKARVTLEKPDGRTCRLTSGRRGRTRTTR